MTYNKNSQLMWQFFGVYIYDTLSLVYTASEKTWPGTQAEWSLHGNQCIQGRQSQVSGPCDNLFILLWIWKDLLDQVESLQDMRF